jgi:hypothetical protein
MLISTPSADHCIQGEESLNTAALLTAKKKIKTGRINLGGLLTGFNKWSKVAAQRSEFVQAARERTGTNADAQRFTRASSVDGEDDCALVVGTGPTHTRASCRPATPSLRHAPVINF